MKRMSLAFISILCWSAASAFGQDILQVGHNYAVPCGSWNPLDFTLNHTGFFDLADSDYVVCLVSAEALGLPSEESICDVDIYAQYPDEIWKDLSLGCYALDTVRFLDHHCDYTTPPGHYVLRAEIDLDTGPITVWSELWLMVPTPEVETTWSEVKNLFR